jgi:hypothetical protein
MPNKQSELQSMRFQTAIFSLVGFISAASHAQPSRELALSARLSWSAFECSSLASVMSDQAEQERLFTLGYEQGKVFIQAARSNRIDQKDINNDVPSGFLMLMQGPTPDFVLGRVFESAQENALKDVITPSSVTNKELKVLLAQGKFSKQNCNVLRAAR